MNIDYLNSPKKSTIKVSGILGYVVLFLLCCFVNNTASAQWCSSCTNGTTLNNIEGMGSITPTTARQVANVTVGGSTGGANDAHKIWWSFTATAGVTYVFDLCDMGRVGGYTSNRIYIYDGPCATGDEVTYNQQAGNGGGTYSCHNNGYAEFTCTTSGTYYVLVSYSSCAGNITNGEAVNLGYYYFGNPCSPGILYFDPRGTGGSGSSVGTGGNYYRSTDYKRTYTPPAGFATKVVFTTFNVHSSDRLYVYDGNSTAATQVVGSPFTGTGLPGGAGGITSTAADGSLTFVFEAATDFTVGVGWEASVNSVSTTSTTPAISGSAVTCTSPTTTLNITNPLAGMTYSWSGPSTGTGSTLTPASVGTYTVIGTATGGCTTSATYTVALSTPVPTVSISSAATVINCTRTAVTLNGNTNASSPTYTWAGPATGSSSTVTASSSGTYSLTVRDGSSGCTNNTTLAITTNTAQPNLSVGASPTITCVSSTATLSGSSSTGGATYAWTGPTVGSPAGSAPTASATVVSANGTYTLTTTNPANGCTTASVVTVNTNTTLPNISTGSSQTITCTNTVVTASGSSSTGGVNYAWTGPSSGSPAGTTPSGSSTNVTAAGVYTLTVTNPVSGCNTASTVAVSTNTTAPNIGAGVSSTITCAASTATLNGSSSTGGVTYAWTGPTVGAPAGSTPTNSTTSISNNGNYTLTVTNPVNGCRSTSVVAVSTNTTTPNISTASATATITCTSSTVSLNGNSSTGGVSYAWTGPSSGSPAGSTPTNSTTVVSANGTYTLTVTNPVNSCTNTAVVAVSSNTTQPNLSVGVTSQTITCTNTVVTLSGSSSTGGVNYAWTGPSSGSPAGTTPSGSGTNVTASGVYTITVTNPVSGCNTSSVVSVTTNTTNPDISANVTSTITCTAPTATLNGSTGTSGATYAWTGPSVGAPAGSTPTNSTTVISNNGTYTLTVTDPSNGCRATALVPVSTNTSSPNVSTASSTATITCTSSTISLNGNSSTGGVTYSWTGPTSGSPAGSTPTNSTTVVSANGTYTLTVTNPVNNCTNTAVVAVSSNTTQPNLSLSATAQTITCASPTVTLNSSSSTGGVNYAWTGPSSGSPAGTTPSGSSTNVTASGVYTVTVTNPVSGCNTSSVVSVSTSTNNPDISANVSSTITCAATTATLNGSAGTPGMTFSWTGPTSGTPAGSAPTNSTTVISNDGTYTLTVTNPSNGCSSQATVPVSTNTILPNVATASSSATITCTSTTLSLSGSSSSPGVDFSWTGPAPGVPAGSTPTNSTTVVSAQGTYTLTVTDPVNNCSSTAIVDVSSDTSLPNVATAGSSQTITCTSPTITLSGSSSTGGVDYAWTGPTAGTPAGTTPSGSSTDVTASGNYTLTVTSPASGCNSTAVVAVSTSTNNPDLSTSVSSTITCSATTATLSGSAGTPGVTYSWDGPTSGSPAGSTPTNSTTVISNDGTYTLTVTDPSNGCTSVATVPVTTNTLTPDVNMASSSVTITCTSSTLTLSGSSTMPGADYAWTGPASGVPAGSTPTASTTVVSANGTYTLTVTNPVNNCTNTAVVAVSSDTTVPNVSTATSSETITCTSSSVTLNGSSSSPGVDYAWTGPTAGTPAGTTPTASTTAVSADGTYTLTVTDPVNNCASTAIVAVSSSTNIPDISLASTSQTITCVSSTISLSGSSSASGVDYAWTGPTSGTPAGTTPTGTTTAVSDDGTYTLTVTNPVNSCSNTAVVSVSSNTTIPDVATASSTETITCTNSSITLSGNSTMPGVDYSWTGPAAGVPAGSTPTNSTTVISTDGTYTLTVTNPVSTCSATAIVSVSSNTTIPDVATANASQTITCSSSTITLNGSSTTPGVDYSWTGPTAGTPAGSTPTSTVTDVSAAGTYTFTVTDPVSGCADAVTVSVSNDTSIPQISAGSNQTITCTSSTVTLSGGSTTSGVTYSWTGPASGAPAGSTPNNASTDVSTDGTYTLTVSDPVNGCSVSQEVSVASSTTVPTLNVNTNSTSGSTITCTNASVSFTATASGNASVSWTGPAGPISGNPVSISEPGTYTATALDGTNGCSTTYTFAVATNTVAPSNVSVGSSADTLNCANPTISFTASSTGTNTTYSWSGPGNYSSNAQNPTGINAPGTYTVVATDATNGCAVTSTLSISQGTNPVVSFTATPLSGQTPLPVDFTNTSTGGFSGFDWSFGNGSGSTQTNASTVYTTPGTYTVVLVGIGSTSNCNDTATVIITVDQEETIEIPNVFTPNGDGTNDMFYILSKGYVDLHIEIFNRWGQRMTTMDGVKSYWDGKAPSGEDVPDATYFYFLTAKSYSGKEVEKTGTITLIR